MSKSAVTESTSSDPLELGVVRRSQRIFNAPGAPFLHFCISAIHLKNQDTYRSPEA